MLRATNGHNLHLVFGRKWSDFFALRFSYPEEDLEHRIQLVAASRPWLVRSLRFLYAVIQNLT
jgi:hypothetical protein